MTTTLGSILLIDDDTTLLAALDQVLEHAGFEVVTQSNASMTMQWMTRNERWFDVIITDLTMPGPDGMEVLATAKAKFPGVPVIVITALGDGVHYMEAMRQGADAFLAKPFNRNELLSTVRRVLSRKCNALLAARAR